MNVSSPTNAADYNDQPPQSSSSTSKPPSESTNTGILPPQDAHSSASNRTEAAGFSPFPRVGAQKFHPERFASQATAAALSLCADSDSPEEESPATSASHPSKLPSLNRQNRKCKSAVIQVDGRSFTIGEPFCFFVK